MEKPTQLPIKVCVGVLSKNGNVSPPMAMFLASQPYFWNEFDCKIFDDRVGNGWFNIYMWLGRQDADYYVLMDGSTCPDPNVLRSLISRHADVVVPPVWEDFNGQKKLNVTIDGNIVSEHRDCGYERCEDASLSILCISRRVLSHLLMAMESINDKTLLAPIKALDYPIFVDWTISPTYKWEDEFREHRDRLLHAYGIWYTRVKRGLPV